MPQADTGVSDVARINAGRMPFDDLLSGLRRLDSLLAQAVTAAQVANGPGAAVDPFHGLHINEDEVTRLLARAPDEPILYQNNAGEPQEPASDANGDDTRLSWLKQAFDLSTFDIDLILITLAPELDLRYERLYAYLQDDMSKKRPTIDLALNLLHPSAADKLARRVHCAPDAPLVRHGLLHPLTALHQAQPPLPGHYFKLDAQIVRFLLGQDGLDARLAPCCQIVQPTLSLDALPFRAEVKQALSALLVEAQQTCQPLRLYFQGPRHAGTRQTAEALAAEVDMPLLVADLVRALAATTDFEQALRLRFREAWFQEAMLSLDGVDALRNGDQVIRYQRLLDSLTEDGGIAILSSIEPWLPSVHGPLGMIDVLFPISALPQCRPHWQTQLAELGVMLNNHEVYAFASRFRLSLGQIAEATLIAYHQARWRVAARPPVALSPQSCVQLPLWYLISATRAQLGHDLATLAHKITPVYTWEDIVLPNDALAQLYEICQRVIYHHRVMRAWGATVSCPWAKGLTRSSPVHRALARP